jgi:hypothetical protein
MSCSYEQGVAGTDFNSPSPNLSSSSLSSSFAYSPTSYSTPQPASSSSSTIAPFLRLSSTVSSTSANNLSHPWNFPQASNLDESCMYSGQHAVSPASSNFSSLRGLSPMVDRGRSILQDGYASTRFSGVPSRDFYQSQSLQVHLIISLACFYMLITIYYQVSTLFKPIFCQCNP